MAGQLMLIAKKVLPLQQIWNYECNDFRNRVVV